MSRSKDSLVLPPSQLWPVPAFTQRCPFFPFSPLGSFLTSCKYWDIHLCYSLCHCHCHCHCHSSRCFHLIAYLLWPSLICMLTDRAGMGTTFVPQALAWHLAWSSCSLPVCLTYFISWKVLCMVMLRTNTSQGRVKLKSKLNATLFLICTKLPYGLMVTLSAGIFPSGLLMLLMWLRKLSSYHW